MKYLPILLAFFLLYSCSGEQKENKHKTTLTSGKIYIGVEPAFRPVMEAEIDMFRDKYKEASVQAEFLPEAKAVERFLDKNDSLVLIVIPRTLTPEEDAEIKKNNLSAKTTHIAYDAIAVIVHPDNMLRRFTTEELKNILTGRILSWEELKGSNLRDTMTIVVEDANSSTVKYLQDSLPLDSSLSPLLFATGDIAKTIDYVAENENAIGFVPLNWISDRDDSTANKFLDKIAVCRISNDGEKYYEPFQYYILQKNYPFIRNVYCIHKEHYSGLATGFTAFVAGPIGQKIIHAQDLLPARTPLRVVEFKEGNLLEENK